MVNRRVLSFRPNPSGETIQTLVDLRGRIDSEMSILPTSLLSLMADKEYLMPYIQHIPSQVDYAQDRFLKICDEMLNIPKCYDRHNRQGDIGGFIDESRLRFPFSGDELYTHWYRFMCIDRYYREWCQPFDAIHCDDYNIENCCCINDRFPELVSFFRDNKIDQVLG